GEGKRPCLRSNFIVQIKPIAAGLGIIDRRRPLGDQTVSSNDLSEGAQNMARMLALDVGDKRIGVAVSDCSGTLATPVETLHRKKRKGEGVRIVDVPRRHDAVGIVEGFPKMSMVPKGSRPTKSSHSLES